MEETISSTPTSMWHCFDTSRTFSAVSMSLLYAPFISAEIFEGSSSSSLPFSWKRSVVSSATICASVRVLKRPLKRSSVSTISFTELISPAQRPFCVTTPFSSRWLKLGKEKKRVVWKRKEKNRREEKRIIRNNKENKRRNEEKGGKKQQKIKSAINTRESSHNKRKKEKKKPFEHAYHRLELVLEDHVAELLYHRLLCAYERRECELLLVLHNRTCHLAGVELRRRENAIFDSLDLLQKTHKRKADALWRERVDGCRGGRGRM